MLCLAGDEHLQLFHLNGPWSYQRHEGGRTHISKRYITNSITAEYVMNNFGIFQTFFTICFAEDIEGDSSDDGDADDSSSRRKSCEYSTAFLKTFFKKFSRARKNNPGNRSNG